MSRTVKAFLDERHRAHYRVINLCREKTYAVSKYVDLRPRFAADSSDCITLKLHMCYLLYTINFRGQKMRKVII